MKDQRGIELNKGQTVVFSQRTGDFGAHKITDGTIVAITPKMVRISYNDYFDGDIKEGQYYPNVVTVVELPSK